MDNYQNNAYSESYDTDLNVEESKSVGVGSDIKVNKHPVLTLQLVIVICITLFLFIVKFCSADLFSVIISRYESEVSKSIIYNGDFDSLDFSDVFSTDDEV